MPTSKPVRTLRFDAEHRILTIRVGSDNFRYAVAPDGEPDVFRLGRLDGGAFSPSAVYHVLLSPAGARCDCPAGQRWNRCKHADALRKLAQLGQLPQD